MLLETGILLIFVAFLLEYIDSTLGMGYGTTLTPVLLLMGFEPLQIVPAALVSQLAAGFLAAGMHHKVGNVDFKDHPHHLKIAVFLGVLSTLGAIFAVAVVLNLPQLYIRLYIGLLVAFMGIIILWKRNHQMSFSWPKIAGLGILASFNKGISGGGYGPLVVTGQMFSGVNSKSAVAITSLAEGIACFAAIMLYYLSGAPVDWTLAPFLMIGAVFSAPMSAHTLKRIKERRLTLFIGGATITLGIVTLVNALGLLS